MYVYSTGGVFPCIAFTAYVTYMLWMHLRLMTDVLANPVRWQSSRVHSLIITFTLLLSSLKRIDQD